MRRLLFSTAFSLALATAGSAAFAQSASIRELPATPELSPAAETYQQVGLSDVRISYSSPAARDRDIWGGLVPYGEIWRAGANGATRLSVSTDFSFGGTEVPAGEYTLVVLPADSEWTFILNNDPNRRHAYGYDESEDVARATVTPAETTYRERMLFLFDATTPSGTHLTLDWAGMMAAVPIEIATDDITMAGIETQLSNIWRPHYNAARYLLDNDGDLDQAATWMGESIAINANWWNHWFMAKIEAERGNTAEARSHAEMALEMGAGDSTFENFFLEDVEAALAEWE